jgi:hypothetical protein
MIPTQIPGHYLPDIKRYIRPIDGFTAPDIADDLPPGELPKDFELPEVPAFKGQVDPDDAQALVAALADPHASLIEVANDFEISLESLSVWMQSPEIQARLETIGSAAATRAVFVAKSFLPAAARSAGRILALHQIARRHNPGSIAGDTHNERRFDKTALHAGNLLMRIAKLGQRSAKKSPAKPAPNAVHETARERASEKASEKAHGLASPQVAPAAQNPPPK